MADSVSSNGAHHKRRWLDRFGIGLGGLCVLHCLATIVIVLGLGGGGHFLLAPEIHTFGLAIAMMIAAFAFGWGAFKHRIGPAFVFAFIGLFLMGAALVSPHGMQETLLTLIGLGLVTVGHLMNLRASH